MEEQNGPSKAWAYMQQKCREKWKDYETWVRENPEALARVESIFRTIAYASYMFTGAAPSDQVIAELIYSMSNLLVFFNDNILRKAFSMCRHMTLTEEMITKWLTVIEHIEVFLELAALKTGGDARRWIIIAAVHVLRAFLRFILLFKYSCGIQPVPPMSILKRDKNSFGQYHSAAQAVTSSDSQLDDTITSGSTFKGQRSGRVIRTLDAAPDINHRSWKVPAEGEGGGDKIAGGGPATQLSGLPLLGEVCHISRPVVHLCCLLAWGQESWKPWIFACAVDLANLYCLHQIPQLNQWEEDEHQRRTAMMLFYLLRSPCYDKFSSSKLLAFLSGTGRIWGLQTVSKSLSEYLPKWQRLYFYNWVQ